MAQLTLPKPSDRGRIAKNKTKQNKTKQNKTKKQNVNPVGGNNQCGGNREVLANNEVVIGALQALLSLERL
jgi:hypothetical protein